jgi:hypothetical protein
VGSLTNLKKRRFGATASWTAMVCTLMGSGYQHFKWRAVGIWPMGGSASRA